MPAEEEIDNLRWNGGKPFLYDLEALAIEGGSDLDIIGLQGDYKTKDARIRATYRASVATTTKTKAWGTFKRNIFLRISNAIILGLLTLRP